MVVKEEYIFRKDDQPIPIKNKINGLLLNNIKFLICTPDFEAYTPLQHPKLAFLNCLATSQQKVSIATTIILHITNQQNQTIRTCLTRYHPLILSLIENDLIDLSRVEVFIRDLAEQIKAELQLNESRVKELEMVKFILAYIAKICSNFE